MSERPEEALKWLAKGFITPNYSRQIRAYIAQLEAELKEAKADSARLDELGHSTYREVNEQGVWTFMGVKYGYDYAHQTLRGALDEDMEQDHE